jgi:hypothetical protein
VLLRKVRFFALVALSPVAVYASPEGISGTNCSVGMDGALTCYADALEFNTGDLKNTGATVLNNLDGLKTVNLSVAGTTGNILNTDTLELIAGGADLGTAGDDFIANGYINTKGYVYNGTNDGTTKLDGKLKLEGGDIDIGAKLLNLSSTPGYSGIVGALGYSNATVFIRSHNQLSINGDVWNNTTNGTTANMVGGAMGGITLASANGQIVNGNFTAFGGEINLINEGVGTRIDINGTLRIAGNGIAGGNNRLWSAGGIEIGLGSAAPYDAVILSSGSNTLHAGGAIDILGKFTNSSGAGATTIEANSLTVGRNTVDSDFENNSVNGVSITVNSLNIYGLLTNTAGQMKITSNGTMSFNGSAVGGINNGVNGLMSILGGQGMILGVDGLTVAGRLDVGYAVSSTANGNLEITNTANNVYTITSYGDVNVAQGLMIATGRTLNLNGANNIDVDMSGIIRVKGNLDIETNINSFSSGDINSGAVLSEYDSNVNGTLEPAELMAMLFDFDKDLNGSVDASEYANLKIKTANSGAANDDITVGDIENELYSNITLDADDNITMGYVNNKSLGNINLYSRNLDTTIGGYLYNNTTGNVMLYSGRDVSITGDVRNSGAGKLAITNGRNVNILGALENALDGKMYFGWNWNDADLDGIVDAGEESVSPISSLTVKGNFTNNGSFHADVTNDVLFGSISMLANAKDFYLKGTSLKLWTDANTNNNVDVGETSAVDLSSLMANVMDSLYLELTADSVAVGSITNGDASKTTSLMTVKALNVATTGLVQNVGGDMTINATGSGATGNITIGGDLWNRTFDGLTASGGTSKTVLHATEAANVSGEIRNFADLTIIGDNAVNINNFNNYATAQIRTNFGATRKITVSGNINNYGTSTNFVPACSGNNTTTCPARDLYVLVNQLEMAGNFTNNSGSSFVYMNSDAGLGGTYHIQKIDVLGGRMDLGGNGGTMIVRNGITVASGAYMNIFGLNAVNTLNGAVSVGGDVSYGKQYVDVATSAGDLNIVNSTFTIDSGSGTIGVGGNVILDGAANTLTLRSTGNITIGGNVRLQGAANHTLTLGNASAATIGITGSLQAVDNGNNTIVLRGNTTAGSLLQNTNGKIQTYGDQLTVNGTASIAGGIDVGGGTLGYYGLSALSAGNSLVLSASTLTTGGVEVGTGMSLGVTTSGSTSSTAAIRNNGTLSFTANGFSTSGTFTNDGTATITNTGTGTFSMLDILNTDGLFTISNVGRNISTGAITINDGQMIMNAGQMTIGSLLHTDGTVIWNGNILRASTANGGSGLMSLAANLAIGTPTDSLWALNATQNNAVVGAVDLVTSSIIHYSGSAGIEVKNTLTANNFRSDVGAGTLAINAGTAVVGGAILNTDNFQISGGMGFDETNTFVNAGTTNIASNNASVANGIVNSGTLNILAAYSATLGEITNTGTMTVSSSNAANDDTIFGHILNQGAMSIELWGTVAQMDGSFLDATVRTAGIDTSAGHMALNGHALYSSDDILANDIFQDGVNHTTSIGSISVLSNDYSISAARDQQISISNDIIGRAGNTLTINTTNLFVGRNLDSRTGTIVVSATDYLADCLFGNCHAPDMPTNPNYDLGADWNPWLKVEVMNNVSGNTQFLGIGRMHIGGNYTFTDDSMLTFAVLPKDLSATYTGTDSDYTYYGGISQGTDGITLDLTGARPIVDIDGKFTMDLDSPSTKQTSTQPNIVLENGNLGLTIFDAVRENSVVWLLQADGGIENTGYFLPRNLSVYFCNADGTKCFNYMDSIDSHGDPAKLPVYLRMDSSTGDPDNPDSLFAVFDPAYGGPIIIYKIQPEIIPLNPSLNINTSARVIDDWVSFGLANARFTGVNNPIETILAAYGDTQFEGMAQGLYDRMESYKDTLDRQPFYEFSRLFVPTEAGQFAHMISSSERMVQQSLSKRMIDEALWTRNRVKSKAWTDFDYGMQTITDSDEDDPIKGSRMSLSAGYDSQISQTTIVGANAGMTLLDSSGNQELDLSYGTRSISGKRNVIAKSTSFDFGGYLLSKMTNSTQFYLTANLNTHQLSVSRDQTYMDNITGSGNSSSFMGEFGLIHSLSAQYIVGNLSARFIQSNGFTLNETVNGAGFMNIKQAGYTTFAPGYSLTFQKRIYLKPTFIMRPYLFVGADYEMTGMPNAVQYDFASSKAVYDYGIKNDPLWMTGKVGLEFLTIGGMQFGAGYEYHQNSAVKTHNVHVGGSYRF